MKSAKIEIAVYGQSLLTNSDLMRKLKKNYNVFACVSLGQIRQTIKSYTIRVLLLEIGMKGKELKILKEILDKNPRLRVITLGVEEPKEHLIKAFKYGSKDFFKMPLNVELLIERIENIVKRNQRQSTFIFNGG